LRQLGVSAGTVPVRTLTAARLARAVRAVLDDPSHARAAATLADRIATEDGPSAAVRMIERLMEPTR
jgi:UDP:flavonoid glycosyltransferase YjiC (YdhE family)